MANLITTSLSFNKENIREYFIKPLLIENDIRDLVDIRLDIKSGEKLNYFNSLGKITKAYAQGTSFTGSTGVTLTQKTLTVNGLKAQVSQNAKEFEKTVMQSLIAKGVDANDPENAEATIKQIIMDLFIDRLKADLQRILFFADPIKELRSLGVPTDIPDPLNNVSTGFWSRIKDQVADGSITQRVNVNHSDYLNTVAVAEVNTATMTGTEGTCNITYNNADYLFTFATSLTASATAFVNTHAASILARDGKTVVTSSGADIIFTSGVVGQPITVTVNPAETGDATGSVAVTTANVKAGTLKAGAGLAILKATYNNMKAVLKQRKSEVKFIVTSTIADSYRDSLETGAHDGAQSKLVDGITKLYFRGIEVVERLDWDVVISQEFDDVQPHLVLCTIPKNLVVGHDGMMDDGDVESVYDFINQERIFRCEYKIGTQLLEEDFISVAF